MSVPEGWTEETLEPFWLGPVDPYPVNNVGEALIYYDHIYDENDEQVGEAVGYVNAVYRRADGHLMTTYNHTAQLPDGNFTGTGLVDRTAMLVGGWNTFHIRGTTGVYEGKVGTMRWRILQVPPDYDTRVSLDITLCG
ncbi:allene oxide cyclase barrel-like domain-containing protein [Streptomyces mayteni]